MAKRSWIPAALALLALFAALGVRGELLRLPEVRPAAAGGFDTNRAMERLTRILGDEQPHPTDSAANDAVRERLIAELRAIGLEPQVTDNIACDGSKRSRSAACARVRNVVATIGPPEGKHLLLVSHYDSTPAGPGAADDGIGTAAMLETAAQLRGKPLKRPVTFLFNEGEEVALLGARAFLDRDPAAQHVDTLLNFESRGVSGPALMFETSRPNGMAIAHLQRAVANPTANSMATDFYRLIPNSTDVAVFERRPWTILNFAVIGNETRYHSAGDTLAALDRRSLQHMGDQALALSLDIAGRDPPAVAGNLAFTDVLGRALLVVPSTPAIAGVAVLLLIAAVLAWRRTSGRALATVLAAMTSGAALTYVLQFAVRLVRQGDYWRAYPIVVDLAVYATVLLACAAALVWIGRKLDAPSLRRAFWLVFLALGTAASVALPGASILFLLPAVPAVAGLLFGRRVAWAERAGAIVAALLLYILWVPLLWLIGLLLEQGSAWIFAPIAAAVVLPWLIEARAWFDGSRPLLKAWAGLAAALWIGVALTPAYSLDRKQEFGIEYALDPGRKQARWLIVNDRAPLPDIAGLEFEEDGKVPWSTRSRWYAPAPAGLAQAPGLDILGERRSAEGRVVTIRLRPAGAEWLLLRGPPEARLIAVQAGGSFHRLGGAKPGEHAGDKPGADEESSASGDYSFRCQGRSCDGMTVQLLLGSKAPVEWTLAGFRAGLPDAAKPLVAARPATAQPQYTPDTTIGISRVRF